MLGFVPSTTCVRPVVFQLSRSFPQWTCGERGDGAECQNQTRASRNPQVTFIIYAGCRPTVVFLARYLPSDQQEVSAASAELCFFFLL